MEKESMKKVELNEEMVWIWECPYCEGVSEEMEEQDSGDIVICEHCKKECVVK